jgi:hypothetical protein
MPAEKDCPVRHYLYDVEYSSVFSCHQNDLKYSAHSPMQHKSSRLVTDLIAQALLKSFRNVTRNVTSCWVFHVDPGVLSQSLPILILHICIHKPY